MRKAILATMATLLAGTGLVLADPLRNQPADPAPEPARPRIFNGRLVSRLRGEEIEPAAAAPVAQPGNVWRTPPVPQAEPRPTYHPLVPLAHHPDRQLFEHRRHPLRNLIQRIRAHETESTPNYPVQTMAERPYQAGPRQPSLNVVNPYRQ